MQTTASDLMQRHRLTVVEFHRMGEAGILREDSRVELIEGELVDMTPIGSQHAGTVNQLSRLLTLVVGADAIVSTQAPVVLGQYSEPQPDIALLQPRDDFYKSRHPVPADVLLLIEVADTSLRYDREVKIPLYAQHGIREVWLVDLAGRALEIHEDPSGGLYRRTLRPADLTRLSPASLPGVELDLSAVF